MTVIKLFAKSQILRKDEVLTVFRQGTNIPRNVDYIDAKPIKRNGFEFSCRGNVQPLNARDLLLVPEGDRFKEQLTVFVNNDSFVVDQGLCVEDKPTRLLVNDILNRLGSKYQVQNVEDWGSYSKCTVMRIDVGPEATP